MPPPRILSAFLIAFFAALHLPVAAQGGVTGAIATYSEYTMMCPRLGPPDAGYQTLSLNLNALQIEVGEDDPGNDFEFNLLVEASIYHRKLNAGPNDNELDPTARYCGPVFTTIYREYSYADLAKGHREFPLFARFNLVNVPSSAIVHYRVRLNEIDDWSGTDYGDLNPVGAHRELDIVAYPFADFFLIGLQGNRLSPDGVPFGTPTEVFSSGLGNGEDFRAGLKFNITATPQPTISGAVPAAPKGTNMVSGGVPVTPIEDHEPACRSYALTSVEQNQAAERDHCGFAPPVWSNDHQMHFDWCMHGANNARIQIELDQRAAQLAQCAQQVGADQACRGYADQSVAQFQTNVQRDCGFLPPVWSADWNGHFNWCKAVGAAVATPELAKRDTALAGCGG